ncbi:hypothetical protein OGAPHI_002637 [Ogataea philodendri]|uniref:Lysophospholipase n=1 Tax=Ogataea philodendri TaxID=1378263 RepID=A0A9P8PBD2_9ASCO|nr:uncharacterized protein OGAPHI_002637 [Ogataea philodendri]KAH3668882.1 hypothetical protein OGAPHI_002637 [Ogataea philodendri]
MMYFNRLLIGSCFLSLTLAVYTGRLSTDYLSSSWNTTIGSNSSNSSSPSQFQVKCPSYPLIRNGDHINPEEQTYIEGRKCEAKQHLLELFERLDIDDMSPHFFDTYVPNIAISLSGGSFRSFLTAAGILEAFDERTPGSLEPGHLGGLLQSTSYMAGVSGGSWLILSLMQHDFKPVVELKSNQYWKLNSSLVKGLPELDINYKDARRYIGEVQEEYHPTVMIKTSNSSSSLMSYFKGLFKTNLSKNASSIPDNIWNEALQFYETLHKGASQRKQHGHKTSLTDYWGKAIADTIFPNSKGSNMTMSEARKLQSFKQHQLPFPIVLSNSRNVPKTKDGQTRIFEFNIYEFGSWERYLNSFVKLDYLGTHLVNGRPIKGTCTTGFDDVSFIAGASSSLFNTVFGHFWNYMAKSKKQTYNSLKTILNMFGLTSCGDINGSKYVSDFALIYPNPFLGYSNRTSATSVKNSTDLYLVDGGEDENIPFQPFHQKSRHIDVVFAVDSSSDLGNYPNGTNIFITSNRYKRSTDYFVHDNSKYSMFPKVPSPEVFVESGLCRRPVFFGCNIDSSYNYVGEASKFSNDTNTGWLPPLIVYIPNTGYTTSSNKSTFKLSYSNGEVDSMIQNGYNVGTYGNSSYDANYSKCVGCAIIKRRLDTTGQDIPETCEQCFRQYCYN